MITHKGKKIDYIEHGEGPAILFIPGSSSTPSAWSAVQKLMPPNYRFISTSLCGYGSTEELRSTDNYGMHTLIDIIETVVAKIGQPLHLVGHSFGGTWHWLVRYQTDSKFSASQHLKQIQ